jgi:hypothetical protein
MKIKLIIISIFLSLLLTNCVQKTYKKTIVFTLDVSDVKMVKKVGIRGNDKPLSWDADTKMNRIKGNERYQVIITGEMAYTFTGVKFVVNDTLELQNEANRRVLFSKKDTTFFHAKFNKR